MSAESFINILGRCSNHQLDGNLLVCQWDDEPVNINKVFATVPLQHFTLEELEDHRGVTVPYNQQNTFEIYRGCLLKTSVPKNVSGIYFGNKLEDLLSEPQAHCVRPKELFLLKEKGSSVYFYSAKDTSNNLINAYFSAVSFAQLLIEKSSNYDETISEVTFFDVSKLEIKLVFCIDDLEHTFPIEVVEEFCSEPNLVKLRGEVLTSTLWSLLKDCPVQSRFSRLLVMGNEFSRHLYHNFSILRQEYTLENRQATAREEELKLEDSLNKVALGVETQALAIPACLFIAARFLEWDQGYTSENLFVVAASATLSIILLIGAISKNCIVVTVLDHIHDCKKRFSHNLSDDLFIRKLFKKLRLRCYVLITAMWIIAVSSAAGSIYLLNALKTPETTTPETTTPETTTPET